MWRCAECRRCALARRARDGERPRPRARAAAQRYMREHMEREAHRMYRSTHAPATSAKQLLLLAFQRFDKTRGGGRERSGDVTVAEFAAVWNDPEEGLRLMVPVLKKEGAKLKEVYIKADVPAAMALERYLHSPLLQHNLLLWSTTDFIPARAAAPPAARAGPASRVRDVLARSPRRAEHAAQVHDGGGGGAVRGAGGGGAEARVARLARAAQGQAAAAAEEGAGGARGRALPQVRLRRGRPHAVRGVRQVRARAQAADTLRGAL